MSSPSQSASIKRRNDRELNARVTDMVGAMEEALRTLVDRELKLTPCDSLQIVDTEEWLATLTESMGL